MCGFGGFISDQFNLYLLLDVSLSLLKVLLHSKVESVGLD